MPLGYKIKKIRSMLFGTQFLQEELDSKEVFKYM